MEYLIVVVVLAVFGTLGFFVYRFVKNKGNTTGSGGGINDNSGGDSIGDKVK